MATPIPRGTRGGQLRLLLAVIRHLHAHWARVEELAEALEIERRTAFRVIRELRAAGFLQAERHGEHHRYVSYRLIPDWWRRPPRGATGRSRKRGDCDG